MCKAVRSEDANTRDDEERSKDRLLDEGGGHEFSMAYVVSILNIGAGMWKDQSSLES